MRCVSDSPDKSRRQLVRRWQRSHSEQEGPQIGAVKSVPQQTTSTGTEGTQRPESCTRRAGLGRHVHHLHGAGCNINGSASGVFKTPRRTPSICPGSFDPDSSMTDSMKVLRVLQKIWRHWQVGKPWRGSRICFLSQPCLCSGQLRLHGNHRGLIGLLRDVAKAGFAAHDHLQPGQVLQTCVHLRLQLRDTPYAGLLRHFTLQGRHVATWPSLSPASKRSGRWPSGPSRSAEPPWSRRG